MHWPSKSAAPLRSALRRQNPPHRTQLQDRRPDMSQNTRGHSRKLLILIMCKTTRKLENTAFECQSKLLQASLCRPRSARRSGPISPHQNGSDQPLRTRNSCLAAAERPASEHPATTIAAGPGKAVRHRAQAREQTKRPAISARSRRSGITLAWPTYFAQKASAVTFIA